MSEVWTPNCKYTIQVTGIQDLEGNIADPFQSFFYTTFKPLWANPDVIKMDLRSYIDPVPDYVLYTYIYMASMTAYRATENNPDITSPPNPELSLDELLAAGYDRDIVAYIECYVRWKVQYDLIGTGAGATAAAGGSSKTLGDFIVNLRTDPSNIAKALDLIIKPRMEECFYHLAGRHATKGGPQVISRASTQTSVDESLRARNFLRPGFKQHRNWDWGPASPYRRGR